jgi:SPP1 family predicted phage head-tail adaptor
MRSGDLNRQVTIQARATTQDAAGQQSTTWTDVVTVNAKIQPLSGRELELAKAFSSEVDYQIEMRYRTNLTAANRLVYQGKVFNVHAVIDVDTRHEVLQVMASAGLNDG